MDAKTKTPGPVKRCPVCSQEVEGADVPVYDPLKQTLYFRGDSVRLKMTEGVVWETLMKNWPERTNCQELYGIWKEPDIDGWSNLKVQMSSLRRSVAHMGISIKNVRSNSADHAFGGYWPEWEGQKDTMDMLDLLDAMREKVLAGKIVLDL